MRQKAIRALFRQPNHWSSGVLLQYSSCGRIGHWSVVSDDIASCRADQDSWFRSACGEPATPVEKPQVSSACGTSVQGCLLVPQAAGNKTKELCGPLHNMRQLNRSSQSNLSVCERLEIDWLISGLAYHRHPVGWLQ